MLNVDVITVLLELSSVPLPFVDFDAVAVGTDFDICAGGDLEAVCCLDLAGFDD